MRPFLQESRFAAGFPEVVNATTGSDPSSVTRWRKRCDLRGFVRVKSGSGKKTLLTCGSSPRRLSTPRERSGRAIIGEKIVTPSAGGFKGFLALALLEEIDPERPRDFGRDATV